MQAEGPVRGYATVKAAALFLQISIAKLYALMKAGDLPFMKLGKSRRLKWADVEALADRHTCVGQR